MRIALQQHWISENITPPQKKVPNRELHKFKKKNHCRNPESPSLWGDFGHHYSHEKPVMSGDDMPNGQLTRRQSRRINGANDFKH